MLAFKQLFNVFNYVEKNRRYKFLILLILMILSAIAEGLCTGDIGGSLGTKEFTHELISRLKGKF